jgi:hypothetical protein
VQLQLPYMAAPFDQEAKRAEFLALLRERTGWSVEPGAKFPKMLLTELASPQKLDGLVATLDWVVDETRRTHVV